MQHNGDMNQGGPNGGPQATYDTCPSCTALSMRMRYGCGETFNDRFLNPGTK
jgi:hypothetical protein